MCPRNSCQSGGGGIKGDMMVQTFIYFSALLQKCEMVKKIKVSCHGSKLFVNCRKDWSILVPKWFAQLIGVSDTRLLKLYG